MWTTSFYFFFLVLCSSSISEEALCTIGSSSRMVKPEKQVMRNRRSSIFLHVLSHCQMKDLLDSPMRSFRAVAHNMISSLLSMQSVIHLARTASCLWLPRKARVYSDFASFTRVIESTSGCDLGLLAPKARLTWIMVSPRAVAIWLFLENVFIINL